MVQRRGFWGILRVGDGSSHLWNQRQHLRGACGSIIQDIIIFSPLLSFVIIGWAFYHETHFMHCRAYSLLSWQQNCDTCELFRVNLIYTSFRSKHAVQGSAKEWTLRCVTLASVARGGQGAGITQPRAHFLSRSLQQDGRSLPVGFRRAFLKVHNIMWPCNFP